MLAWTAKAQIALGVLGLAILMLTAFDMVGNMSISGAPDAVGRSVSLDWPKVIWWLLASITLIAGGRMLHGSKGS